MSTKLVVDIWHSPYGDASTVLVLMALADEANDKGEFTADLATIAKKARQSQRNCQYLLRKLENLGIVECFEARGRGYKNSYRVCIQNMQNLQKVQKVQKVQPLQVLEQDTSTPLVEIKGAKGATLAGFTTTSAVDTPSPLHSPSQDLKSQDLDLSLRDPGVILEGGESLREGENKTPSKAKRPSKEKRTPRYMPTDEEGQAAIHASIFDANLARWHQQTHPLVDLEAQWAYFLNACLSKGYEYIDFRAAFMNSFRWESSPARQSSHRQGHSNASVPFVSKGEQREDRIKAINREILEERLNDAHPGRAPFSERPRQLRDVTPRPTQQRLQEAVLCRDAPKRLDD